MLPLRHYIYLPVPLLLSFLEWSIFSLYWSAAAGNSSRAISSESAKSRRLHEFLLNIALVLVILPLREWNPQFLPEGWLSWVGLSMQTVSVLLAVWARRHLASHWSGAITIKVDHKLIRSGPYRFLRHPIYAAILGMFIGSVILSGRYLALVGLIIAAFAYQRKIRLEEANLKRAFGTAYDIYRSQTGSFTPRCRKHDSKPEPD